MMAANEFGPGEFQSRSGVGDETLNLYASWLTLLSRWNSKINLVASSTLDDFWLRHALDSHQTVSYLPKKTRTIIDLGAGAGFPGIAMAIAVRDLEGARVTMVESNGKKCNFLRAAIRELSLPAEALQKRAEEITQRPFDVVTARAFAPLPRLFSYAQNFWREDTVGVFPKGESWEAEIIEANADWDFQYTTHPSQTDERARIIRVESLQAKTLKHSGGVSIDQKSA